MSLAPTILFAHFNPRSREGSDIKQELPVATYVDFNPRSREGSDLDIRI